MARTYNVIDADGHILEPVDIWEKYMDPSYRDRAPKMIIDTDGKERLLVEGKVLGSPKGMTASRVGIRTPNSTAIATSSRPATPGRRAARRVVC